MPENDSEGTSTEETVSENEPDTGGEQKPEKERTLTQSEFDAALARRLAKYKDFDSLKEKASKFDELEAKDQSEAERLQAELDKIKADTEANTAKYQTVLRRSAIISEATKAGLVDPDTVFELLMAKGFPGIEIDDEDSVSGVSKAIESLVKEKPFLKTPRFSSSVNGGPQGNGEDDADISIEEYMRRHTPKDSRLARILDV